MSEVFSKENFVLLELGLKELSIERNDVVGKSLDGAFRVITQRYRKLALKYHPDKQPSEKAEDEQENLKAEDTKKEAEKKFKKISSVHSLLIEAIDIIRENKSLSGIEHKLHKLCGIAGFSKREFYYKGKLFKELGIQESDVIGLSYDELKNIIVNKYENLRPNKDDLIDEMMELKRRGDELVTHIKDTTKKIEKEEYEEKKELFEKCNFVVEHVLLYDYDGFIKVIENCKLALEEDTKKENDSDVKEIRKNEDIKNECIEIKRLYYSSEEQKKTVEEEFTEPKVKEKLAKIGINTEILDFEELIKLVEQQCESLNAELKSKIKERNTKKEKEIEDLNGLKKYIESCRRDLRDEQFEEKKEIFDKLNVHKGGILGILNSTQNQLMFKINRQFNLKLKRLHSKHKSINPNRADITMQEILRMQARDDILEYIEPLKDHKDIIDKDKEKQYEIATDNMKHLMRSVSRFYLPHAMYEGLVIFSLFSVYSKFATPLPASYNVIFFGALAVSFISYKIFTHSMTKYKRNLENKFTTQEEFENQVKQLNKRFVLFSSILPAITLGVMAIGVNSYSAIFLAGLAVAYICHLVFKHFKEKYKTSLKNGEITSEECNNKMKQLDKYHTFAYHALCFLAVGGLLADIIINGLGFMNVSTIILTTLIGVYNILFIRSLITELALFSLFDTLDERFPGKGFCELIEDSQLSNRENFSWHEKWLVNAMKSVMNKNVEEIIPDQSEKIPEEEIHVKSFLAIGTIEAAGSKLGIYRTNF